MAFEPDWRHFHEVMKNRRPKRLPIYEHLISTAVMEKVLGVPFSSTDDLSEFFHHYCGFFREMTYDVVPYEVCITEILPQSGALSGGKPGPIQNRADFKAYPWDDLPAMYWELAEPRFTALAEAMPEGMKAVGGVGTGVFENSEDLVGLMYLPFMQSDDPGLYADLFTRIGDLMLAIWKEFLKRHKETFVACRFGDDLGFKSSLLTNPATVRERIIPQYRRIVDAVHAAGKPFLYHSCGCIFEVMEEILSTGIDAKHSNEDAIAPFERWIVDYGDRIGLLGGLDMDFLCQRSPEEVKAATMELGRRSWEKARGFALGSGNSIPEYVPLDNYLALIEGSCELRESLNPNS